MGSFGDYDLKEPEGRLGHWGGALVVVCSVLVAMSFGEGERSYSKDGAEFYVGPGLRCVWPGSLGEFPYFSPC